MRVFRQPVESGRRRVLVVELWDGVERDCAHRCLNPAGSCSYTLDKARFAKVSQMVAALG